jgi:hypothetical protein
LLLTHQAGYGCAYGAYAVLHYADFFSHCGSCGMKGIAYGLSLVSAI